MGMFSWNTSDTKESIPASGCGRPTLTVYLLSPTGKKYQEDHYAGDGEFSGADVSR